MSKLTDQGWISVKDRLPAKEGDYLIYDGYEVTAAHYWRGYDDNEHIWADIVEEYSRFDPTHWMPLPEPPKEG